MKVKELKEILNAYPDYMEVVLFRPECEDYESFYDLYLTIKITDDNQLAIE